MITSTIYLNKTEQQLIVKIIKTELARWDVIVAGLTDDDEDAIADYGSDGMLLQGVVSSLTATNDDYAIELLDYKPLLFVIDALTSELQFTNASNTESIYTLLSKLEKSKQSIDALYDSTK